MRITGGLSKGRLLASLRGLKIRPTSDRVRQAVFNLIGQDLAGLKALDLFAGTGSLGIEALSRGASWCLFIDNSVQSIKIIRKNLELCGFQGLGSVLRSDLRRGLPRKTSLMNRGFDLIFVDPPYRKGLIPSLLKQLGDRGILASPSFVVAQSAREESLPAALEDLRMVKTRTYGETKIHLYRFGEDR
jgi:16S rRNA (guanine966-N2)-methyltransferase